MSNEPRPPGSAADAERDAYLQGALRHAPDANLAPPTALNEAIVRAARGAAAPQAAARSQASAQRYSAALRWLAARWAALGQPRLAGAVAGLTVATLAGVLWWGEPLERALDAPALPDEVRSKVADTASTAISENAQARRTGVERAPAEPAPAAALAKAGKAATAELPSRAPAAPPAAQRAAPQAEAEAFANKKPETHADADAPASIVPAPAQAGPPVAPQEMRAESAPPQARAAPRPAMAQDSLGGTADSAASERGIGAATAAAPTRLLRERSAPAEMLADLRSRIAAQPQRWTWRLGQGEARAVDAPLLDWLTRLEAAAGADLQDAAPAEALANAGPLILHLLRDAQLRGSVQLGPDAVRIVVIGAPPQARRAGLAPHTARDLEEELTRLAR